MSEALELVGSWRLVSYRICFEDGSIEYPLGADADGLLVYTSAGFMTGGLMRRGRPRFAASRSSVAERQNGTADEIVAAFNSYFSYFCRFETDPGARKVTHHVLGCQFPDWEGRTLERFWELNRFGNGVQLSLTSAPLLIHGRMAKNELKFERQPDAPLLVSQDAERGRNAWERS